MCDGAYDIYPDDQNIVRMAEFLFMPVFAVLLAAGLGFLEEARFDNRFADRLIDRIDLSLSFQ